MVSLEGRTSLTAILLTLFSIGYLAESFGDFLFTGNGEILAWIVGLSAAVGGLSLTLWLLIKGIRGRSGKNP